MVILSYSSRWNDTHNTAAAPSHSWFGGLARRWRAVKIAEELRSLSDHELDDIGIARRDITEVARRSAGA